MEPRRGCSDPLSSWFCPWAGHGCSAWMPVDEPAHGPWRHRAATHHSKPSDCTLENRTPLFVPIHVQGAHRAFLDARRAYEATAPRPIRTFLDFLGRKSPMFHRPFRPATPTVSSLRRRSPDPETSGSACECPPLPCSDLTGRWRAREDLSDSTPVRSSGREALFCLRESRNEFRCGHAAVAIHMRPCGDE